MIKKESKDLNKDNLKLKKEVMPDAT